MKDVFYWIIEAGLRVCWNAKSTWKWEYLLSGCVSLIKVSFMTTQRWLKHNFNVLSSWLLYSNMQQLFSAAQVIFTELFYCLATNQWNYLQLVLFYMHYIIFSAGITGQNSCLRMWGRNWPCQNSNIWLLAYHLYRAALITNLFIWQNIIRQLVRAGLAHWYFIIHCFWGWISKAEIESFNQFPELWPSTVSSFPAAL